MPRPNKPRHVYAEEHLAERIATERQARGWTLEGLAERMSKADCAMSGSAVYKIEQGTPRRRITVDELVAFSRVFGVPVSDLLTDPELLAARQIAPLLDEWRQNLDQIARLYERNSQIEGQVKTMAYGSEVATAALEKYWDGRRLSEDGMTYAEWFLAGAGVGALLRGDDREGGE